MVWLLAAGWRAGLFRKVLVAGVSMVMLVALLLTGSREGLIGLAVLCLIAFVRSSLAGKAMILIAVVAMLAGAVLFLPRSLKSRFATIFHSGTVEMQDAQTEVERKLLITAAGSFQGRRQVLLSSLKVTMRHPLLGVGPGNFAPYMADQAKSTGTFALWVGTHNTYTQLSSEAGIPALCLFVAALVSSMRALGRIYRRGRRIPGKEAHDIASMALALHTSFVAFCVCGFFNHMAYEVTIPLMAGITVAMTRTASKELNRLEDVESRQEVAPESSALVLPHRSRFVAG
jgi:O-antigen ligase